MAKSNTAAPNQIGPFVARVRLQNFRSIAECDVTLGKLVFLVGRNGSGKSNFLDGLRFIAEGLRDGLDYALEHRGGVAEVRRRSKTKPFDFSVQLSLNLADGSRCEYAVTIGTVRDEFKVKTEKCRIERDATVMAEFTVFNGRVSGLKNAPAASADRLYLVNASGLRSFRPVYDRLKAMAFYNFVPDRMREPAPVDSRAYLARDGRNIGAIIGRLEKGSSDRKKRIEEYLAAILPGLTKVERYLVGTRETVEFSQNGWVFEAEQMSDGTLRALGVLAAVLRGPELPLVGIEEPEIALHPAAFGMLRDALREGAESSQVLVTSQSPELLDDPEIKPEQVLAVRWEDGQTKIAPLGSADASMLRDQLVTAGELLRQGQLAAI